MSDYKVTTWASKQFTADFDEMQAWSEDWGEGIYCLSPQTAFLAYGLIDHYMHWGSRWLKSSDPQNRYDPELWKPVVETALQELSMVCNIEDQLERIATVMEKEYDSKYVNLQDLVDVLPLDSKYTEWTGYFGELAEALDYIVPDWPFALHLPKMDLFKTIQDAIFRKSALFQMYEIQMALKAHTVGQQGPTAKLVIDALIASLPASNLVDMLLGDLDETVASITDGIITILTGNYVTNRLDDIAENLEAHRETSVDNAQDIITKWEDINQTIADIDLPDGTNAVEALNSIESAIRQIQLVCSPGISGCYQGSINEPDPHDGEVTIGPGEIFEDQPAYDDYKCRAANYCAHGLVEIVDYYAGIHLDDLTGGAVAILSVIGAISAAAVLGAVVVPVVGALIGIAVLLVSITQIELDDMVLDLSMFADDLVCALYLASDATEARAALNGILDNTSMTSAEKAVINAICTNAYYNVLFEFFQPAADYPTTTSCAGCAQEDCPVNFQLYNAGAFPEMGSGDLARDGQQRTLTSAEMANGFHYINFKVGPPSTGGYFADCEYLPIECDSVPEHRFNVEFLSITAPIISTVCSRCIGTAREIEWNQGTLPLDQPEDISWIEIIGDEPFSVEAIISVATS